MEYVSLTVDRLQGQPLQLSRSIFTAVNYHPYSKTLEDWTRHAGVKQWIKLQYDLCKPSHLYLCDGTERESKSLLDQLVAAGSLVRLDSTLRPNSFAARSPPGDVARVESRTFICSAAQKDAGPNNNWQEPSVMRSTLTGLLDGCMAGRTMYAVPFCMGPLGSPLSEYGVQLTDSPYVVVNLRIMTRMGTPALDAMSDDKPFVPCMHTLGVPLKHGQEDVAWPSNATKYIVHFPETREVVSYGSGYGGNAILPKKCFALRIASVMARDAETPWMAEHMLIVGLTAPDGRKKYIAAAFPSACGKTNLAMLTLPDEYTKAGWRVSTVGDDIAWMRWNVKDGTLRAVNPEAGMFGVAPGTNPKSNPAALAAASKNTLFTNVAVTPEGDVWWEGLSKVPPPRLIDWKRREWFASGAGGADQAGEKESTGHNQPQVTEAAHPNSRFTAPAAQVPCIDSEWENPEGVPISAILFGGRRSDTVPLVYETLDWAAGVYAGATMQSEMTAAAEGTRGVLRSDPMAMKPFTGYNMADYWAHWLSMEATPAGHAQRKVPSVFFVNWFRKDEQGQYVWPGFGDNARVLEWVFRRVDSKESGSTIDEHSVMTPIGRVPDMRPNTVKKGLNLAGTVLDAPQEAARVASLVDVQPSVWQAELARNAQLFRTYDAVPAALWRVHDRLHGRLEAAAHGKPFEGM